MIQNPAQKASTSPSRFSFPFYPELRVTAYETLPQQISVRCCYTHTHTHTHTHMTHTQTPSLGLPIVMASALKPPSLSLTREARFFLMSCRGSESHVVPSTEKACTSKSTSSSGFSLSSTQRRQGLSLIVSQPKVNLPPRVCTLREFGEGVVSAPPDETVSDFFKSLSANIEFSAEVQDWEVFSGRLAMMVFASALVLEAVTGNSVFEKLDSQRLLEYCAAIVISILVAAGLAVALQAKTHVAYTVSKGYEKLINVLIDNVIDSILFDSEDF